MSDLFPLQALVLVCGTIIYVASLRFVRRYLELKHERERSIPGTVDGLAQRLERIEMTVEATAIEVERVSEANRFMSKLLADRSEPLSPASRPPERVITPH